MDSSKWKTILWSGKSRLLLMRGNHRCHILQAKGIIWLVMLLWSSSALIHVTQVTHVACTHVKAWLMLNDIYRFLSKTCCRPDYVFFRKGLLYFSKTWLNDILPLSYQTAWHHTEGVLVLNWSASCPELSPTEDFWPTAIQGIPQIMHWFIKLLKYSIKQHHLLMRDNISLTKLQVQYERILFKNVFLNA